MTFLPMAQFAGWSGSGDLWVRDTDGAFGRFRNGAYLPTEPLNRYVEQHAPSKRFGVLPGWRYIGGEKGFAFFAMPSMALVRVFDLERTTFFEVEIGEDWGTVRPLNQILVGSDVRTRDPVVMIRHELARSDDLDVEHRIDVFTRSGQRLGKFASGLAEFSLLPSFSGSGVAAVARHPEGRCLFNVGRTASAVASGCASDMQSLVLSPDGRLHAYTEFNRFGSRLSDGSAVNSIVGAVLPDGSMVTEAINEAGRTRLDVIGAAGDVSDFNPALTDDLCSANGVVRGEPITAQASDGLTVYGVLFSPAASPVGLVAYYHGGPYQTITNIEGGTVAALVAEGFAVVGVNYRGTPGYGTAYMEAGYRDGPAAMARDGVALMDAASEAVSADLPRYAYGVSWGGYLAIRELTDTDSDYVGGFVQSGVCDVSLSPSDVALSDDITVGLIESSNPSVSVHQIRMTGSEPNLSRCTSSVSEGKKVFVAHAVEDGAAPFPPMQTWATLSPESVELIRYPGRSHPAPPRDEVQPLVAQIAQEWRSHRRE